MRRPRVGRGLFAVKRTRKLSVVSYERYDDLRASDGCVIGGVSKDVIAPLPGELSSETHDNSVAILLSYATARVLLAGDAEAREEEYMVSVFCTRP